MDIGRSPPNLGSLQPPPLEIENGDLADPANMYLPYGLPCRKLCGSETTEPIRMKFVRVWLRYPSDSTSQIWREQRRWGGEGRLRRWICIHNPPLKSVNFRSKRLNCVRCAFLCGYIAMGLNLPHITPKPFSLVVHWVATGINTVMYQLIGSSNNEGSK